MGMALVIKKGRQAFDESGNSPMYMKSGAREQSKRYLRLGRIAGVFLLLSLVADSAAAQGSVANTLSLSPNQDPEKLAKAAAEYEKFLREPPAGASSQSIIEAKTRLGTVYFLLHHYQDSLSVLEKLPQETVDKAKASTSAVAGGVPASAQRQVWLVSGLDYLQLNELPQAVSHLHHAVEMQPTNATARLAYGDALARSNRMEDALKEYERQIQQTPRLPEAWYKSGLAHSFMATKATPDITKEVSGTVVRQFEAEQLLAQGRYLDCVRDLFKLLPDAPEQQGLHADLGRALLEIGYPKAAEEQLRKELAIDPANPLARMELAQTAALRGDWHEVNVQIAEVSAAQPRELTRLLEMVPAGLVQQAWMQGKMRMPDEFANSSVGGLWRAWMEQSQLIQVKGSDGSGVAKSCSESDKASRVPGMWLSDFCYSELIKRHARSKSLTLEGQIKLAEAHYRLGQYDRALQAAESIVDSHADNEWGVYWFRNAHRGLAKECFLKVANLDPNSARAHQLLAQDYAAWVQYANARKEYQIAISLAPNQSDLHLGLGTVCWRTDDWAEAEKELKIALELAPESALARYELGDTYMQEGEWQLALEELQKVPANSSLTYQSMLDLARAEDRLGKTKEAMETLLAVTAHDEDGQAHYLLASLYRKSGDTVRAQEALEKFKRLRAATLQTSEGEAATLEEERAENSN
jgi:tetratricopeptide (TPR) repeat protein